MASKRHSGGLEFWGDANSWCAQPNSRFLGAKHRQQQARWKLENAVMHQLFPFYHLIIKLTDEEREKITYNCNLLAT